MRATSDESARLHAALAANSADLLAYLERRVVDREDAADLLAETMLVAWRRLKVLPTTDEDARMWLFGVARKTLLNYSRGRRRRLAAADALRARLALLVEVPGQDVDDARDLREAIARLPTDLAEIVRLIHWEGLSQAEASELLGVPAPTIRGKYSRARATLRASLEAADDDLAPGPVDLLVDRSSRTG